MNFLKFLSREGIPYQAPRRFLPGWTRVPQDALRWLRFTPLADRAAQVAGRRSINSATHHMDLGPCAECPTHELRLVDRADLSVLYLGICCAACGLLDCDIGRHAFESWSPFKLLERRHVLNLRILMEGHPGNFRAWSYHDASPPADDCGQPYR